VLALVYRKYTIRRDKFDWEEEEEDEEGEGTSGGEDGSEETDLGGGGEEIIGFSHEENRDWKTINSPNAEKPAGFAETVKPKRENNWPDNISHTSEF